MLRLQALHHVHVQVADAAGNDRFVHAFGLTAAGREGERTYYRGAGGDAYSYVAERGDSTRLLWLAFSVESRAELERAVKEHGASPIEPLAGPGGGEGVRLRDPEGTGVLLVHGVQPRQADALRAPMVLNHPSGPTRYNRGHDYPAAGAAQLLRLGHVGLFITDFDRCEAWYRRVLGLVPSERVWGEPGRFVGGFYRLDRGAEWVDHHVIAFFAFGKTELHHLSFEVPDAEHQFLAHRHLQRGGWQPVWGVGRHPLGSHVFDVWKDPNGLRFETFTDTDLCNHERPCADHPMEGLEMDLWSNEPPTRYFA